MLLTVEGGRLDAKWVCADGVVRDQFTMIKDANKVKNYTINPGESLTLAASWKGQYSWSHNGATTAFVSVSPATSTTYVVNDQYQCVADTFKVIVAMPSITTSTAGSTICAGTTLKIPVVSSTIFTAGNSFTAQLSDASGSFSTPVIIGTENTSTPDSITVTIPTLPDGNNYSIRIVSSHPPVTGASTNGLSVHAPPVATITGNSIFCPGGITILTAANASNYMWSNGETGNFISVDTIGTYSVTITDANGCTATSPAVEVTMKVLTGDFNLDGTVTTIDLNLILVQFGTDCTCVLDITKDGHVSMIDINAFLQNYGATCH